MIISILLQCWFSASFQPALMACGRNVSLSMLTANKVSLIRPLLLGFRIPLPHIFVLPLSPLYNWISKDVTGEYTRCPVYCQCTRASNNVVLNNDNSPLTDFEQTCFRLRSHRRWLILYSRRMMLNAPLLKRQCAAVFQLLQPLQAGREHSWQFYTTRHVIMWFIIVTWCKTAALRALPLAIHTVHVHVYYILRGLRCDSRPCNMQDCVSRNPY